MCSSIFGPIMDNNDHQGDLTDIFRASRGGGGGGSYGTSSSSTSELAPHGLSSSSSDSWHHHHHQHHQHHHMNFSSVMEDPMRVFGDPFSNMRDPFLHDLDLPPPPSSYFTTTATNNSAMEEASPGFAPSVVLSQNLVEDEMRIRPPPCNTNTTHTNNIFSNMIQISPSSINAKLPVSPCDSPPVNMAAANSSSSPLSPRVIERSSSAVVSAGNMNITVDNAGVQISSPRNPGLKRRKSQAKKVVCIPAPAAANSRPSSGEVVPSDLWAWRKYGQKPIKGSPYPRGYYRCSSSKGCSARKQVERSRTDPNMLVITYTSEHNHPWPTQRNALAGSTRSQPSKHNNNNNNNDAVSKNNNNSAEGLNLMSSKPKEEDQQDQSSSDVSKRGGNSVKEEMEMEEGERHDELENIVMEDNNNNNNNNNGEFSDGLSSYKPYMVECNQSEDFFAELGEIEADPLNLLFTHQGFNEQQQRESKALDPFHLFDWSSSGDHNTNTNNTTTPYDEPKRGL